MRLRLVRRESKLRVAERLDPPLQAAPFPAFTEPAVTTVFALGFERSVDALAVGTPRIAGEFPDDPTDYAMQVIDDELGRGEPKDAPAALAKLQAERRPAREARRKFELAALADVAPPRALTDAQRRAAATPAGVVRAVGEVMSAGDADGVRALMQSSTPGLRKLGRAYADQYVAHAELRHACRAAFGAEAAGRLPLWDILPEHADRFAVKDGPADGWATVAYTDDARSTHYPNGMPATILVERQADGTWRHALEDAPWTPERLAAEELEPTDVRAAPPGRPAWDGVVQGCDARSEQLRALTAEVGAGKANVAEVSKRVEAMVPPPFEEDDEGDAN